MEQANVVIKVKEDNSVQKLIKQKAKTLQKKYAKTRKINERLLKKRTPLQNTFFIIGDVVCVILVLVAAVVSFSGINSRIQKTCPTFAGYANLTIQSGSMVDSGFKIGDTVIVKSVNTNTLHRNDAIAFYVYSKDYNSFELDKATLIYEDDIPAHKSKTTFGSIFGIQSKSVVEAAKANARLVFHHIRDVYETDDGTRWFTTYGSSNGADDVWFISENMVVGLYDNSSPAQFFSKVITVVNSGYGFLILLIPVVLLATVLVLESLKNVEKAKLELDCVEEKRKITDPICVKNNIGFGMDTKTKYKILAQADSKDYNEYLSLLWKGQTPVNIRKYLIKKNLLMEYNTKMLELNRECEKMFAKGVDATKVAEYYVLKKTALQKQQLAKDRELQPVHA